MKKLIALLLAVVLACALVPAFSEAVEEVASQEESQFERVLLKKGTLILKEFITYGKVKDMTFQTACLTDVETGSKYYALRITTSYYNSKYDYGEAVGVMDADEIDGAIQTLEYIKAHISELKDYTEVVYRASSGMEVGAYHSNTSEKIYIKLSSKATNFYDLSDIDTIIKGFKGVQSQIGK